MVLGALGQSPRRFGLGLGFQPRQIEELDKSEGEHREEKNNSRHEDNNREHLAKICSKSNITKTKGGHYRQCPIKAGDPTEFSVFKYHQEVKQDAVDGNHRDQGSEKFYYYPNVPLLFFRNKKDEFAEDKLHCNGPVLKHVECGAGRYLH
jgi:hypothetical protein